MFSLKTYLSFSPVKMTRECHHSPLLVSVNITCTYVHSQPDSAPVPITILPDDLVEGTENFRLELTSQFSRDNAVLGPNINTQVSILDEDG